MQTHLDVLQAVRLFRKTPVLTTVAIACLAAAIGLSAAGFSAVYGAFFAPLPVPGGDRLVTVRDLLRSGQYDVPMTAVELSRRRERATSFEALGARYSRQVTVTAPGGDPSGRLVRAAFVSQDALSIVGVAPMRGRHFTQADTAPANRPVMLGHDVWRTLLGRPP